MRFIAGRSCPDIIMQDNIYARAVEGVVSDSFAAYLKGHNCTGRVEHPVMMNLR